MANKCNIVLVTIDALRYDHCGFNGYARDVSPRLDKIAKESAVVFDNMYSTGPCTPPSFCAMFTATFPFDKGGYSPLPQDKRTIAEVLAKHGYQTAGFTSNPQNSHYFNYHKGFQKFYDSLGASSKNPVTRRVLAHFESSGQRSNALYNRLQNIKFPKILQAALKRLFYRIFLGRSIMYYVPARGITRRAIKWLRYHYFRDGIDKKEFFLWVHYMDTHDPFIPKWNHLEKVNPRYNRMEFDFVKRFPEYTDVLKQNNRRKSLVDLYDAEFRAEDDRIGFLINVFKRRGAYDQTVFILTADHGEEFNDHGDYGHRAHLYNELLHVPFMIFGGPVERGEIPGLKPGTRVKNLFSLGQIAPTILDMLHIPPPASFSMESMLPSLATSGTPPVLSNNQHAKRMADPHVMACTYHKGIVTRFNQVNDKTIKKMVSVQDARFKYILDSENGDGEFYDLENDKVENENIKDKHVSTIAAYHDAAIAYMKGMGHMYNMKQDIDASHFRDKQDGEDSRESKNDGERAKILAALGRVKLKL